jgi:hypothetical protein
VLRLLFARMLWPPPVMLDAYMSNENFWQIGFRALTSFQWIHWVRYSTRTVLRRWGVAANFALQSLLSLLVSVLPASNLIAIR